MTDRARLQRSLLVLPGNNRRFLEKAAASEADAVLLDLEDAVAEDDKDAARETVVAAINDLDWGAKSICVRVNALDGARTFRDVIAVVSGAGERLDTLMLPKTDRPGDVQAVDTLVRQVEMESGLQVGRIGLEVLIESAAGMASVEVVADAATRVEALHFGPGDFAASMGVRSTVMGGANPDYHVLTDADAAGNRAVHWGDASHYALARIAVAARAAGRRPIDGAYSDFVDVPGYRAQAKRARALGFEGKWCIHPSQVPHANELFSPDEEEVAAARRILDALGKGGSGAVVVDGRMVDAASIRQAEVLVARAEAIAGRG